jgi:cytochrome P450
VILAAMDTSAMSFVPKDVAKLNLVSFLALFVILLAWKLSMERSRKALRSLPTAKQAPLWKRLLTEPSTGDFLRWSNEIENSGLIRFYGAFNKECLLVTRPEVVKEVLQQKAYHFHKLQAIKNIMQQVTGYGLLVAEGDDHKVRSRISKSPFIKTKIDTLHSGSESRFCQRSNSST